MNNSTMKVNQNHISESSYRRGYHQGYFQALQDLQSNKDKLLDFVYDEIEPWREEDHRGNPNIPPRSGSKAG